MSDTTERRCDSNPASGRFLLRIDPGLHAALREAAREAGVSLNEYCAQKLSLPTGSLAGPAGEAVTRAAELVGDTLLGVVAIDDAWGLIIFSILLVVAKAIVGDGGLTILMNSLWEVGGAVAVGAAVGVPAAFLTGRLQDGEPIQTEALSLVFLCAGMAIWLEVSYLLAGKVDASDMDYRPGDFYEQHRVETILGDAATENVDTGENMADGVARTLEVRVTAAGLATFFIDGVKFAALNPYSFDTAEVIVPFIHWLQVTGGSDLGIQEIECGPLWMVRKDPLIDAVRGPSV